MKNAQNNIKEIKERKERNVCVSAHTQETPNTHTTDFFLILILSKAFLRRGFLSPQGIVESMLDYYKAQGTEKTPDQLMAATTNWNPTKALPKGQTLPTCNKTDAAMFIEIVDLLGGMDETEQKLTMLNDFVCVKYNQNEQEISVCFKRQETCKMFWDLYQQSDKKKQIHDAVKKTYTHAELFNARLELTY